MTDNVVLFDWPTRLDLPPERVLGSAQTAGLEGVVVVGWLSDGEMWFGSSYAAGPEVLWLLELAKKRLLEIGDADDPLAG